MAKQTRTSNTKSKTRTKPKGDGTSVASQAAKAKIANTQTATIIPDDTTDLQEGVTSPRELLSRYRTAIVELSSGAKFKIRSVNTGDFYAEVGALLFSKMIAANVDTTDPKQIQEYTENQLPIEEQLELVNTEENLRCMQAIVCASTISINFINKPQPECNETEISIDLLSERELGELSDAIVKLSNPDNDIVRFSSSSETKQTEPTTKNGTDQDSSDS